MDDDAENSNIRRAQADVRRLLTHAVGRVRVKLDPALVAASVAVMRADPAAMSATDEVVLWRCVDQLTQAVAPATAQTIELIEEMETDRKRRPGIIRLFWRDTIGRKQIASARWTMVAFLSLVLIAQIYTLVLNSVVTTLQKHEQQAQEIEQQIGQLRQAKPDLDEKSEPLGGLVHRKMSLQRQIGGGYRLLFTVSAPWRGLFGVGKAVGDGTEPEEEASTSSIFQEAAQTVLQALALYVLPVLYGVLGAAAYILRRLNTSIEDSTFSIILMFRYRLRLALGALMGATIGLFLLPDNEVVPGASLSLVAMSFLAGYSVEVVFAFLDSLIERARSALRPADASPAAASAPLVLDPVVTAPAVPEHEVNGQAAADEQPLFPAPAAAAVGGSN